MEYKVEFSINAQNDLFEIYYYVAVNDSFERADHLRNKLLGLSLSLSKFPFRGHNLPELKDSPGNFSVITSYPYRIIYEVIVNIVTIHCILDGRRNVQDLLKERLLR